MTGAARRAPKTRRRARSPARCCWSSGCCWSPPASSRARTSPARARDPRPAAAALRGRLEQALASAARALEPKAATAARLSEVVSGLDLAADPHTFEDLLQNEDWWAPYRAEFPVSGVITSTGALALLGPNEADVSATAVVRQAREAGVASGTVALGGRPFMLAAARVPRANVSIRRPSSCWAR